MATPAASPATAPIAPFKAAVGSAAPPVDTLLVDELVTLPPAAEEEEEEEGDDDDDDDATSELESVCMPSDVDVVAVEVCFVTGGDVIEAFSDDDMDADPDDEEPVSVASAEEPLDVAEAPKPAK